MAKNDKLSDETKNDSTGTPSSQSGLEQVGKHENAVVPHKISDHDKLVQTMVMVDGTWVNVNDTNDQKNMAYDMTHVSKAVTEAQKGIVEAKNTATSAVKSADSAISASKANSDAIVAQNAAISDAQATADSAVASAKQAAETASSDAAKIRSDIAAVQAEVDSNKEANAATVKTLQSDVATAKSNIKAVSDGLDKAKSANDSAVAELNSSVSAMQKDVADNASAVASTQKDLATEKSNLADLSKQLSDDRVANSSAATSMSADLVAVRSDLTSNSSAIASYSKQLDSTASDLATYAKSASEQAKDIVALQKDSKSLSAAIADTQGDVVKVQQTADSAQVSASNNAKDISSLKVSASDASLAIENAKSDIADIQATATKVASTLKDHDGRISTVEQTATKNASTIADVQSNVSSVEQTANGVKTAVANQAKDITEIKTTAKGQETRITSAEKAVNDVQSDVNGLKETVSDNKGNISKLQTSATKMESDIKDANGNISKAQQTADGAQLSASNNAKDISKVKATADGLSADMSNAKKDIASIKVNASGISTRLSGVETDTSNLKNTTQWRTVTGPLDLNNLKTTQRVFYKATQIKNSAVSGWQYVVVDSGDGSKVTQTVWKDVNTDRYVRTTDANGNWTSWKKEATSDDIANLNGKITINSTAINQTKKMIELKADQSTVNNLTGEVEQNKAQLKVQADQISSKVSSEDFKALDNKVNSIQIGGTNLLTNSAGPFKPNNEKIDNWSQYFNSTIHLIKGQQYTVSGETNGTWSGEHNVDVESDRCVLWLVNPDKNINQRISDSNTATGTTFTWNYPTDDYILRVNVYHPNSKNKIYAKNIKIEKGNKATDWSPAPEDTITSIQKNSTAIDQTNKKLSLKADQTTVDNLNKTVAQNISRLDVTADSIKQTVADQGKNITELQTTAKGTEEKIADAQGDISTIQKTVDGLSATTSNNVKDIHTLQTSATQFVSDIKDAKDDISSLQQTATTLSSSIASAQGDISKAQQTATKNSADIADAKGNISNLQQTSKGLQTTIANAQGDINDVKATAQGLNAKLTTQGNDIATIKANAGNLSTRLSGVESSTSNLKNKVDWQIQTGALDCNKLTSTARIFYQDTKATNAPNGGWFYITVDAPSTSRITQRITRDNSTDTWTRVYNGSWSAWKKEATSDDVTSLNNKITTNSTAIDQTKKAVALKADQKTVNDLTGEVEQNKAQLQVQAGQIDSKVSSEDFKKLDGKVDGALTSIEKNSTAISETNKQVSLKANQVDVNSVKNTAEQNSSRLDVMANEIKLKVSSTDVNNIVDGKGYATQSTVQSLIDQKSNTINESIVKLSNDVRNNGGGINLLRSTNVFSNAYWGYDNIGNWHKDNIVALKKVGATDSRIYQALSVEKKGRIFSVSFDAQISDDCTDTDVIVSCGPYDALQNVHVTSKDLKHYKVENWTWAGASNTFSFYVRNGKMQLSNLKLEYGPVATPWSPAPADNATVTQFQQVTASIDGLKSTVKNDEKDVESRFTQLASGFQSKVFDSIRQASETRTKNDAAFAKNYKTVEGAQDLNSLANGGGYYLPGKLTNSPYKDAGDVILIVTQNFTSSKDKAGKVTKTLTGITQEVFKQGDANPYKRQATIKDKKTTWGKWSEEAKGASTTITQAKDDLNFRVSDGDLISQINLAAGNALIQSGKIYLDADSVVFGKNSKAFIPSAYITDINADQIKTGTLKSVEINNGDGAFTVDAKGNVVANSMFLKNGTIYNGNVVGANLYAIQNPKSSNLDDVDDASQSWFKINGQMIEWHNHDTGSYSSIGIGLTIPKFKGNGQQPEEISSEGVAIADTKELYIGTGSNTGWEHPIEKKQNLVWMRPTNLHIGPNEVMVNLDSNDDGKDKSIFSIQKDNKVGAYFGRGDTGNHIDLVTAGNGQKITLNTGYIGLNGETHVEGNCGLTVYNLHVTHWLGVDGSKNSIVKTSQGTVAINAYETAEYYFGDIGSGNTGTDCKTFIGIEKLFNETVNTEIEYQVFITPYSDARIWVSKREQDRFVVESDTPNAQFGYEIKAKRKGYEHNRLKNVDNELNNMATA